MKQYFIFVVLPAVAIVIFTSWLVPNPSKDNIKEYISKAIASDNDTIAEKEYKNLVRADVNNIENNRGYISAHYSLPKRTGKNNTRDDSEIIGFYVILATGDNPEVADIGHYCLGVIKYYENDYKGALEQYLKVRNQDMPFLNNSVGRCYLELDDPEKAKSFFRREIEIGVNIEGPVVNLSGIFLRRHDTEQLNALMSNPKYAKYISIGTRRQLAFMEGDLTAYVGAILSSYREYTDINGVVAALLICLIWLLFIRRLDIFEPESFYCLFLTLVISAFFSELSCLLYDFSHITLGFTPGNSPLHQLAYCVFRIGLTEEFTKLVPVLIILFFTKQINESTDYIIYASVSALGFALMENIGYFDQTGFSRIAGRAFTATFFHMALSSFAVYGLVYARYKKKSPFYFALSFFVACAIHGLYDFLLIVKAPLDEFRPFAFFLMLFSIIFYVKIFRNVLNSSEFFTDAGRGLSFRNNAFLLVCGLSYVIVVQYLIMAFRFGPVFAGNRLVYTIAGSFVVVMVIHAQFANIKLDKASWLPIFKPAAKKKRKKTPEELPPPA